MYCSIHSDREVASTKCWERCRGPQRAKLYLLYILAYIITVHVCCQCASSLECQVLVILECLILSPRSKITLV